MKKACDHIRELGAVWADPTAEYPRVEAAVAILGELAPELAEVIEKADIAAASLHQESHLGDLFRLSSALCALDSAIEGLGQYEDFTRVSGGTT